MATTPTAPGAEPLEDRDRIATVGREIVRTVLGALSVVLDAARLLLAHWPVLVVLLLLGAAARELVLWACLVISRDHPVLATLLVPLAPLASVTALVAALRAVMPSMRHVDETGLTRDRRLAVLASALVPFLGIYAAQGWLREDTRRFLNETWSDEFNRTNVFAMEHTQDRTWAGSSLWVVVSIVVIALVLRWALDRFDLPQRNAGFGFLAGWVEALWLVTVATAIQHEWARVWAWVMDRQGVAWVVDAWAWIVRVLGPVGSAADSAVSWALGVLGDFDALIVVPMAWLTVGAVVYGRQLGAPAPAPAVPAVAGELRDRIDRVLDETGIEQTLTRAQRRAQALRERTHVLPGWARGWLKDWLAGPVTSLTGRFADLGRGLLTLLRVGLVPMVTLCLVLFLGRYVGVGLALLLRRVIGPQDVTWAVATSPWIQMVLAMAGTLLLVVLVAAAVDRFLVRPAEEQRREEALSVPRVAG